MRINDCFNKSILFSLLLLPLANIGLFFISPGKINAAANISVKVILEQIAIYLFVAVAEEIFFRGLLLHEMVFNYKLRATFASIMVSVLFGLMHLVNVNSYATWGYAIVQSFCAFAVSVNLSAIYIRSKCLLWCIVVHAFINITSIGLDDFHNIEKLTLTSLDVGVFLAVSMLYLISGVKLLKEEVVLEGK